ncbi:MAG: tyrosine-type recombinase/integrase [Treponema sp.]|nr:tyrosine-type recombinase/integrase [Treponema sp.]
MTVHEATDEFLLYLGSVRGLSEHTVLSYRNDLLQFENMLSSAGDITQITAEDIRQCIGHLSKLHRASASINRFIAAVRSLFAYCKKNQYIQKNPALEIKTVKLPKRLPRFMTGAEVDKLCAEPLRDELLWQTRDTALFEMLYSSGCRVSEIASLTLDDFADGYESAIVTGKGKKDRWVYFAEEAQKALKAYLADRKARFGEKDRERAVFVNQRGTKLSVGGISYILSRYSGVEGTNHHVSPHAFRHTFATAMLANGADVRMVQELLGHSSISTTQRYTHINTQSLIEMYNKAHPHGGAKGK